jgi:hypothetical protein
MEIIKEKIDGVEHMAGLKIKDIGGDRISFELYYKDQIHQDTSIFSRGSEDQIRIHAQGVLRELVLRDKAGQAL